MERIQAETKLAEWQRLPAKTRAGLEALGLRTVADLLGHPPRRHEDRRQSAAFPSGPGVEPVCLDAVVADMKMVRFGRRRSILEIVLAPAGGGDARLTARTEAFAASARGLFRAVEDDPADLTAARRYMTVYLQGARDAGEKCADLWASRRDETARAAFESLLDDLEANFTARTRALLDSGREGLEIEIEVLRDRLARDGVISPPDKAF